MTKVLGILAALCLAATLGLGWHLHHGSQPTAGRPLDGGSPEAARLTLWAQQVRAAGSEGRGRLVSEAFAPTVPAVQKDVWARQIAADLPRAASDRPAQVRRFDPDVVRASWRCREAAGAEATLVLLFRRSHTGELELLGIAP